MELQVLKKETYDEFNTFRFEVVKTYEYWMSLDTKYREITKELKGRGLI